MNVYCCTFIHSSPPWMSHRFIAGPLMHIYLPNERNNVARNTFRNKAEVLQDVCCISHWRYAADTPWRLMRPVCRRHGGEAITLEGNGKALYAMSRIWILTMRVYVAPPWWLRESVQKWLNFSKEHNSWSQEERKEAPDGAETANYFSPRQL